MRQFVSRFIRVKKRSRFLSRQISRRFQRDDGVLPSSTFPATSLAKPPAQPRAAPDRKGDVAYILCPGGSSRSTGRAVLAPLARPSKPSQTVRPCVEHSTVNVGTFRILQKILHNAPLATRRRSRNIEMTPLCKVDATLPGVRRVSGVGDEGGVDGQEGIRPARSPAGCAVWRLRVADAWELTAPRKRRGQSGNDPSRSTRSGPPAVTRRVKSLPC
jgi:hypothetical protein